MLICLLTPFRRRRENGSFTEAEEKHIYVYIYAHTFRNISFSVSGTSVKCFVCFKHGREWERERNLKEPERKSVEFSSDSEVDAWSSSFLQFLLGRKKGRIMKCICDRSSALSRSSTRDILTSVSNSLYHAFFFFLSFFEVGEGRREGFFLVFVRLVSWIRYMPLFFRECFFFSNYRGLTLVYVTFWFLLESENTRDKSNMFLPRLEMSHHTSRK